MASRPTVRQVAAEAGVSIATVSRVLSNTAPVTPQTRDLVRGALDRLTTRPRPAGDLLVYVHCPYRLTDYFGLIVSAIAEALELHGRQLILNAGEAAQEIPILPTLSSRPHLGGAVLILPPEPAAELVALRARGFPFVVIDPRTALPDDIAAVSAAHFVGARTVTEHLLQLGHRRIGVLAGPRNWLAGHARLSGHTSALADAGVVGDPALIRRAEPTTRFGHQAAGELLDLPDPPTALIGFNDKVAVGALTAAADRGLRVPADLSVTGFDDIDLAEATTPALTTVRQPLEEMGRMAISLLMRLMHRHEVEALHVELATKLIVRGSTAPVTG